MTRRAVAVLLAAGAAAATFAIGAGAQQQPRQPQLQQQPPAPAATGTASLAGVVGDQNGAPVRLAIVTLAGDPLAMSRSRITDDEGRFAFDALPAGRFTLTAEKAAYIRNSYGSRRAGRPGTLLTLGEGERRADVDLRLPRGAVITGVVRDGQGRPAPGIEIAAIRGRDLAGPAGVTTSVSGVRTDDRGEYRIFGLEPGEYYLTAGTRLVGSGQIDRLSDDAIDRVFQSLRQGQPASVGGGAGAGGPAQARPLAYVATYYPGTGDPSSALTIAVDVGEVRAGADFPLVLVPAATVSGTLTGPGHIPLGAVSVTLEPASAQIMTMMTSLSMGVRPTRSDDGTAFELPGVAPGRFFVTARWSPATGRGRVGAPPPGLPARAGGAGGPAGMHWARAEVTVAGIDVSGIALNLRPGLQVSGRVAFEGVDQRPEAFEPLRLTLRTGPARPVSGMITSSGSSSTAVVAEDDTFEFPALMPARYDLTVRASPVPGWWLRSAMTGGRDALDHGLDVESDDVTDLVLTWTQQTTELSGTLTSAAGEPAPGHFVIVFPTDQALWRPGSRRVQATRPADDGRYVFENLPPGDYRIAALTDVEDGEWDDAAFLAQLLPASLELSLGDGGTTFDLRVARQPTFETRAARQPTFETRAARQ